MRAHPHTRGFTLLEIMIVVGIIGVLTAMAATAATAIGARNATQNAASDIGSILQSARATADQRGTDLYLMVYPTMQKNGSLTGGRGAIFLFEDANSNFLTSTGACTGSATTGDCGWSNFAPPNDIRAAPGTNDRLIKALYLEDYAKKNVRFGVDPGSGDFPMPFAVVTEALMTAGNGCNFCSSGKGAVLFTGDQQLLFLDDTGATTANRVAGLALHGVTGATTTIRFGLVGSTGLITLVK